MEFLQAKLNATAAKLDQNGNYSVVFFCFVWKPSRQCKIEKKNNKTVQGETFSSDDKHVEVANYMLSACKTYYIKCNYWLTFA